MNSACLTGSDDRERSSGGGFHGADEGHHHARPIDEVEGQQYQTATGYRYMKWLQYNIIFYTGADGRRNEVGGILNDEMKRRMLAVERLSDRIWIKVDLN